MTTKERDEKKTQGDGLWKKDRRAVLTLRQDWVAQQKTWHHKDKRKTEKRKRER